MSIPLSIRVIGFVSPEIYRGLKNYVRKSYFTDTVTDYPSDLAVFYGGLRSKINYTKIDIHAPPDIFNDDLWIDSILPVNVQLASVITDRQFLFGFILFVILSVVTGILAGIAIFKESVKKSYPIWIYRSIQLLVIVGTLLLQLLLRKPNHHLLKQRNFNNS